MKKNVLLIYPEFPDTFWSFKHALKFVGRKSAFPPLGLLTVASMLPASWNQRLVDVNIRSLRKKDLQWADIALFSGMAVQRPSARALIAKCKNAGLTVIAGGPLFTTEYANFDQVDHFVLNEAEVTLPEFLHDFENGNARRIYTSPEFPTLENTPAPTWNLIDVNDYASMSIQYSRGCPFNCDFCNVTMLFGHRPRTKNAAQILQELDGLWEEGWRGNIFFVDDNLLGHRKHLKEELLPALIEWQKKRGGITFNTEISIDIADDEVLMATMAQAGFDTVFIGIETPNEESLKECNKRQNTKRNIVEDVKKIQRAGLQVQGGFIVGFDHDTPNIFQQQIDFIQQTGIVTAMVGLLEAMPGTRLYERLKGENRIIEGDTSGDNADGTTNIIPRMNLDTLRDGYKNLMRHLYAPDNYYKRVKVFLREYKVPAIKVPFTWNHLAAFLRSLVQLGILAKGRLQYWKLLIWTSLRKPKLLPLAVQLLIYGYHFRKMCEKRLR